MLIILALQQLFFAYVESAPTHTRRQNSEDVDDNDTAPVCPRGVSGILTPCILTLFLCIWTTIHTNIEPSVWWDSKSAQLAFGQSQSPTAGGLQRSGFSKWFKSLNPQKMVWSVATLLFPEIALFVAAHERKTAYLLLEQINTIAKGHHWDVTVCYYAIMGGFVVEESHDDHRAADKSPGNDMESGVVIKELETNTIQRHDSIVSGNVEKDLGHTPLRREERVNLQKRCTLTPQGLLYLASLQTPELPDCPPEVVQDKNKASLLTRFLVCFQAMWMFIQIVARWSKDEEAVTLLEIYTVLHVFCAMAMYITWFNKPMNIEQPTFIKLNPNTLRNLMEVPVEDSHSPIDVFSRKQHKVIRLTTRAGLGKLLFRQLGHWHENKGINGKVMLVMKAYEAMWNGWRTFALEAGVLSLIGILHGGLHILGLVGDDMLTSIEDILWLLSSSLTAVSVVIFCASVLVGHLCKAVFRKTSKSTKKLFSSFKGGCMVVYCYCFVFSIVPALLARIYLLGESFAALREIGDSEQERLGWADFIPHIS